ncbi:acetamidase/formamidase family protein [Actinophytocola sp.]|uniref:acetamidase/formamidase family protein n=1 Tax=Actinophytocola sp. TaxID=1872138 RepID=UPI002D7F4C4A|nr:acetamidase/formamidase family protein [Actinophytocola sp.]HET9143084.1 acetamidase/formamidase family protein [Actinophytocola sp.]
MTLIEYRPEPGEFCWTFGGAPPVRKVRPGDVISLWTEDCFAGKVRTERDLASQVCEFPFLNPQTGPFAVEGAKPGDTLALHFVSIEPARDTGAATTLPFFGALTSDAYTATLQDPLPELVWIYELDNAKRTVTYHAKSADLTIELPMDPMHGTVGVAPPSFEARSALVPDNHGGNLDSPEMRAGVTAYFGVNVEGALFSLGDGHARQGEGEACGTGVEVAMNTVVIVDLIPGVMTLWPRLESDTHLMSIGAARPLENAYRVAQVDMTGWLAELCGVDRMDAYQLVAQAALTPVAQVCNPVYTVTSKMDKSFLPSLSAYRDTHTKLRELGGNLSL